MPEKKDGINVKYVVTSVDDLPSCLAILFDSKRELEEAIDEADFDGEIIDDISVYKVEVIKPCTIIHAHTVQD